MTRRLIGWRPTAPSASGSHGGAAGARCSTFCGNGSGCSGAGEGERDGRITGQEAVDFLKSSRLRQLALYQVPPDHSIWAQLVVLLEVLGMYILIYKLDKLIKLIKLYPLRFLISVELCVDSQSI